MLYVEWVCRSFYSALFYCTLMAIFFMLVHSFTTLQINITDQSVHYTGTKQRSKRLQHRNHFHLHWGWTHRCKFIMSRYKNKLAWFKTIINMVFLQQCLFNRIYSIVHSPDVTEFLLISHSRKHFQTMVKTSKNLNKTYR